VTVRPAIDAGLEGVGGLDALADRYALGASQRDQLAELLGILEQDERAPTAMRTFEQALSGHVADSLVALDVAGVRASERIVDIGTGAGFPGLAFAVALASSEVTLLESQARKSSFLLEAVARLGLGNANVVCARAEEWAAGVQKHDLALARALAAQPVVLEYAAPLLRVGGRLVDWRGRRNAAEEGAAMRAAAALGLRREELRRVQPFAGARDRHLHVFVKATDTPTRFPRRAGMAQKRPLGVK